MLNVSQIRKLLNLLNFVKKTIKTLGCNVGNVTLHIAKNFKPKKCVGIDIDTQLIFSARKNIRYFMDKIENEKKNPEIVDETLITNSSTIFPKNVYFMQVKYFFKSFNIKLSLVYFLI